VGWLDGGSVGRHVLGLSRTSVSMIVIGEELGLSVGSLVVINAYVGLLVGFFVGK